MTRTIPPGTPYSQPFWLQKPHAGDTYDISDQEQIGLADSPPVLAAGFVLDFNGTTVKLKRPVQYRYVDPTHGELTRPLAIVPAVAVDLSEPVRSIS